MAYVSSVFFFVMVVEPREIERISGVCLGWR